MLLLGASSCLVTASPDFTPPERTRPEIVTNDAYPPSPPLEEQAFFKLDLGSSQYTPVEFSAWVQSEDAGQPVLSELLIDYGDQSGIKNGPYRDYVPGEPLAPGTLADGPRQVTIQWRPQAQEIFGCHTVTLVVTHAFKNRDPVYYCPADPNDSSMLAWVALVCKSSTPADCVVDSTFQQCPIQGRDATYCAAAEGTQ
jgi:hypothetical protein